jgi:hypothetical protein
MKKNIKLFGVLLVALLSFQNNVFAADPLKGYSDAWKETNSEIRLKIIYTFFGENSIYQDPSAIAKGPLELNALITKVQKDFPGVTFTMDHQLNTADHTTWNWQMFDGSKKLVVKGKDFIEINSEGKIDKVIGFFEQY